MPPSGTPWPPSARYARAPELRTRQSVPLLHSSAARAAEYAQVLRMLGQGRLEAQCMDGIKRLCHIRGKMRKKVWVNVGDIVLLGLREYQVRPRVPRGSLRPVSLCNTASHTVARLQTRSPRPIVRVYHACSAACEARRLAAAVRPVVHPPNVRWQQRNTTQLCLRRACRPARARHAPRAPLHAPTPVCGWTRRRGSHPLCMPTQYLAPCCTHARLPHLHIRTNRPLQDEKADVILKYMADEARNLKAYGELPENIRVNDADVFEEYEGDDNDDIIEFDDIDDI